MAQDDTGNTDAAVGEDARWKAAFECVGDGLWDWDIPKGEVYFSDQWKSMLGYAPGEVGSSLDEWSSRVHPDDIAGAYADIERHFRGGSPLYENEHRMRCKDGSYKWILDRGKVIARDADGSPLRMIGTHKDVSRRYEEQRRLRELTNRLNAVINGSSRVSIVATDTSGVITLFNSGAEHLMGYTADEAVGLLTPEAFHVPEEVAARARELSRELGEDLHGFEALTAKARRDVFEEGEWTIVRKDGTHRTVWLTVTALRDTEGAIGGFLGVSVDLTELKHSEARLKVREALFRSYAEADLIGMAISSVDKGWIQFNRQFCDMLGYTPAEMHGLSWTDFTHPDDLAADMAEFNRAAAGETDHYRLQKRYVHKSGGTVWVDMSVRCVRRPDGSIDRLVAIIQDITESKRIEEELRDARKRVEALLTSSMVTIYSLPATDFWEKCTFISENIEALTGIPHGQAAESSAAYLARVHPEDQEFVQHAMETWVDSNPKEPLPLQYRFQRMDGSWIWVNDRLTAVRDESGAVLEYVGALTDVTAEVESTRRLARISQHIPGVIYQYRLRPDGTSHFPYASEGIRNIYGLSPSAVQEDAAAVFALLHPDDLDRVAATIRESAETMKPWSCVYRVNLPDGRTIWVEGASTPQREPDGSVLWNGYIWDVTSRHEAEEERARLEQRLLHAQKLEGLGVLAGGIAHDFNNLLLAIYGNLDLALQDANQEEVRQRIDDALAAARKAGALTNQMLAYSGRGKFMVSAIDVNTMIQEQIDILRAIVPKTIIFELDVRSGLPPVIADGAQLQQVIMNLVSNAAEAIGPCNGTISVSTGTAYFSADRLADNRSIRKAEPGEYVFIRVADTGCGMSESTLGRLFDPFFTTKFTGRGLGMSAVLGIVDKHRGAIFVESAPGRGTTATVLLPPGTGAVRSEGATMDAPKPAARQAGVLVVDDESMVRATTTRLVERLGHRVLSASDGAEAVSVFQARHTEIDCVLLDITMPRMDGAAALAALQALDPGVRVILCSGFSEHEIERRFAGRDVVAVLHKPFLMDDLRRALETALHR